MKVKVITDYYDLEMHQSFKKGAEVEMADARATALASNKNLAGRPLVQIIEEAPKKAPKTAKKKTEV